MLPGLALGTEKPEPDLLRRPPRRRNQPLIDRRLLQRALLWLGPIEALLAFSGYFLVYAVYDKNLLLSFSGIWARNLQVMSTSLGGYQISSTYWIAVTIYHAGVVMAQVGNAFAVRSETNRGRSLGWLSNRFLLVGVVIEICLILIIIYFPPLAKIFQHVPLPFPFWLWLIFYPLILYSLEWIRKSVSRRFRKQKIAESRSTLNYSEAL
jgi:sodium/potassium-transporting ATPase subunit alpha